MIYLAYDKNDNLIGSSPELVLARKILTDHLGVTGQKKRFKWTGVGQAQIAVMDEHNEWQAAGRVRASKDDAQAMDDQQKLNAARAAIAVLEDARAILKEAGADVTEVDAAIKAAVAFRQEHEDADEGSRQAAYRRLPGGVTVRLTAKHRSSILAASTRWHAMSVQIGAFDPNNADPAAQRAFDRLYNDYCRMACSEALEYFHLIESAEPNK